MVRIKISVVLATRNRAPSLARLLKVLTEQINAPQFEVIIGDNNSHDNTKEIIKEVSTSLNIYRIHEEQPGKSRTLNAVLKLTKGDLIVFTDDDVIPKHDWLAQLHAASKKYPECKVFGGRIDVNIDKVPKWIARSYNLMSLLTSYHNKGDTDIIYGYYDYPFGPNMAIRKQFLPETDRPYPEHVGPGTKQPVGDEIRFFMQISPPEGDDRMYVSKACVLHHVEDENIAFITALKRCFVAGKSRGLLGHDPVFDKTGLKQSTALTILSRLKTCRSVREFVSLSFRHLGYRWGVIKNKYKF